MEADGRLIKNSPQIHRGSRQVARLFLFVIRWIRAGCSIWTSEFILAVGRHVEWFISIGFIYVVFTFLFLFVYNQHRKKSKQSCSYFRVC